MAHDNKIEGIGGLGSRPPVGSSSGIGGSSSGRISAGGQAPGIDTHDQFKGSEELAEEPGAGSATSGTQPTLGVPGINHAGVISPTSGSSQGHPKGIHSGGAMVSGQLPGFNFLSGTAGKLYS